MKHDELARLINFCKTVQKEGTDPFDLNISKFLKTLSRYLKKWKSLDDLLLDAEVIAELAKIIELQGKWIRDRSSSFYIDPVLIELKIKMLEPVPLADAFYKSWHPVLSLDSMTPTRLKEGLDYWNALVPLTERKVDFPLPAQPDSATLELEDLIDLHIVSEAEFEDLIKEVLKDLEERGKVEYHDFIYGDDFEDSITKAYLTSYLVSEGKAEFDRDPLEEEVFISPNTAQPNSDDVQSIPISLSHEDWLQWRQKRNQRQRQNGR